LLVVVVVRLVETEKAKVVVEQVVLEQIMVVLLPLL
jgi:hypothetical protein